MYGWSSSGDIIGDLILTSGSCGTAGGTVSIAGEAWNSGLEWGIIVKSGVAISTSSVPIDIGSLVAG